MKIPVVPISLSRYGLEVYADLSENNDLHFHSIVDERSTLQRIDGIIQACFSQIKDLFKRLKHYFYFLNKQEVFIDVTKTEEGWKYDPKVLPWANNDYSEGLYVFVHGLRGSRLAWGDYLKELENLPAIHCAVPAVPEEGNCSLKTAAEPLLALVRNYLNKFPGQPINLIGTSTGGRIISYIETQLTPGEMQNRVLNVASIAGVHRGTRLVNWLDSWHVLPLARLHPELAKEFCWESEYANNLLGEWRDKQKTWEKNKITANHFFCVGLEDEKVFDHAGCLPKLNNSIYELYVGENHQTVVQAARGDIMGWLRPS
jgi:hypothetical protein